MRRMTDTISYHGRRSVDELAAAMQAVSLPVTLAHRELSLLHLDRFVSMVLSAAEDIHYRQAPANPATEDGME